MEIKDFLETTKQQYVDLLISSGIAKEKDRAVIMAKMAEITHGRIVPEQARNERDEKDQRDLGDGRACVVIEDENGKNVPRILLKRENVSELESVSDVNSPALDKLRQDMFHELTHVLQYDKEYSRNVGYNIEDEREGKALNEATAQMAEQIVMLEYYKKVRGLQNAGIVSKPLIENGMEMTASNVVPDTTQISQGHSFSGGTYSREVSLVRSVCSKMGIGEKSIIANSFSFNTEAREKGLASQADKFNKFCYDLCSVHLHNSSEHRDLISEEEYVGAIKAIQSIKLEPTKTQNIPNRPEHHFEKENGVVEDLLHSDQLLIRAVDGAALARRDGRIVNDCSTLAEELTECQKEGLGSVSTTLVVENESVPAYKAIGYFVNGKTAQIEHVAEGDSLSSGNSKNGDFIALAENLGTTKNLAQRVRETHPNRMNEVNVSIGMKDIVGLFYVKSNSERNRAQIMVMQKMIGDRFGMDLPIYEYDQQQGAIHLQNMNSKEIDGQICEYTKNNVLRSSTIYSFADEEKFQEITEPIITPPEQQKTTTGFTINEFGEVIRGEQIQTQPTMDIPTFTPPEQQGPTVSRVSDEEIAKVKEEMGLTDTTKSVEQPTKQPKKYLHNFERTSGIEREL